MQKYLGGVADNYPQTVKVVGCIITGITKNMAQLFVYRTNSQMRGGESSTPSHEGNYEFALFTGT